MGSSPVVGAVTAVASASSAATPPSPGNTCLSARTEIVKSRIHILAAAAAHVDLRWMPLYWRARARLGLPLSSLELTHARPPSAATVDAVLSLLVDECPGAQNEEAGGRGARRMVGPKARVWLVSIRTTSTESRGRSPGAIPGRAGGPQTHVSLKDTWEGKGLSLKTL